MRERWAKMVAAGTGLLVVLAIALFAVAERSTGDGPAADPVVNEAPVEGAETADALALGARVYRESRCGSCHSIAGRGSPRSPLDGVGGRLSEEELRLWVVAPQTIRPGVRKPAYDDLPEEQVAALVAYMASLE